ncbi:unnamed protein product [Rhizoctonia solani]|uniref:Uncharacterized protein n=1 Tax=Rhizoctonia solani TaxID=456999 RepID=A0A8H2WJY7_9AGAM|nr:unnamed protein product [Rhizoctonia solani]
MPTVYGAVVSNDGSKFIAVFMVGKIQYTFTGTLKPQAAVAFTSAGASLTYANSDELSGVHSFSGTVGVDTLELNLDNKVKIEGKLDTPLQVAVVPNGAGTWATA